MQSSWFRAAAGIAALANVVSASDVLPVLCPSINITIIDNVIPTTNVTLSYANATDTVPSVNVTLAMSAPSVLLEAVASISIVDCSPNSVEVTFTSADVFATAQNSWPRENFTLITNHLGDCDAELERGFFLVESLSWCNKTLKATARSKSQTIAAAADMAEISFGGLAAAPLSKRALVLDPTFTLPVSYALPPDTTLYSYPPYLTVAADQAGFNAALTVSGYLKYSFLAFKLEELYFDIDTKFDASVTLTANIAAGYNSTFTYAPSALTYSFVNVPGIISLGPALKFAIGAQVAATGAVDITTDLGISLADGNVHIDALHQPSSKTSGWVPTYKAGANISASVEVDINPFVDLTVELAIEILGGLVDLSSGLTAKSSFTNEFIFTAAEGVDLTGVHGLDPQGKCSQGLAIQSDFGFEVDLFVTQFYSTKVYEYKADIADVCYSWQA
ncbi:hypothetical protein BCR34DRAFT_486062 [Clohesyomyces aquaticus]|uniref:DUF7029 domain-containing protein n=1 Tax=Clohesyomyces aquaticus TaxID=1231657 RepID=A0A1Y1ZIU3_9PLEO|nr:hypothetical protein BCR34DRAFT_486062 [Clohesyomyces aquaticus]